MEKIDYYLKDLYDWSTGEAVCGYIRSGISAGEKRRVLLEVERMIKEIVGETEGHYFFRLFSETEASQLESLLGTRSMILDEMILHTPEEVERFRYQNEKLLRLSEEASRRAEDFVRTFFRVPHSKEELMDYELEKSLTFTYGDEDAVINQPNDDYYGSDFRYMLHLIDTLTDRIPRDSASSGMRLVPTTGTRHRSRRSKKIGTGYTETRNKQVLKKKFREIPCSPCLIDG